MTQPGRLFLVPTPLDLGSPDQVALDQVLPLGTLTQAAQITHWICENAKSARAFLKRVDACVPLSAPISSQHLIELPERHTSQAITSAIRTSLTVWTRFRKGTTWVCSAKPACLPWPIRVRPSFEPLIGWGFESFRWSGPAHP